MVSKKLTTNNGTEVIRTGKVHGKIPIFNLKGVGEIRKKFLNGKLELFSYTKDIDNWGEYLILDGFLYHVCKNPFTLGASCHDIVRDNNFQLAGKKWEDAKCYTPHQLDILEQFESEDEFWEHKRGNDTADETIMLSSVK